MRKIIPFLVFCFISLAGYSQTQTITGNVMDELGIPLSGVSIVEKGTANGTTTNAEGTYTINVSGSDAVLVISSVGYTTQEINVKDGNYANIVLAKFSQNMEDVVVVGYGTQRRKELTGSISSVDPDNMKINPTTNVNEMLRGQAAGVQVTLGSARPGGTSSIKIRGTRTLGGSEANQPLFVLDGVPVQNVDDVNPNDIESVEILKDAAATAIYGARAANGVVLITTKRGKAGKTIIDFGSTISIQQLKRNFDFYSAPEWAQLRREAFRQGTTTPTDVIGTYPSDEIIFTGATKEAIEKGYITDWEKIMLRDAVLQKYDLAVRMGNENSKFAGSFGKFIQDGMAIGSGFDRNTIRLNFDQRINSKISFGGNISHVTSKLNREDGSFTSYITIPPYSRAYDDAGNVLMVTGEASQYSPLWNEREASDLTKSRSTLLNFFGDWKIIKNLKYRVNISNNHQDDERKQYRTTKHTSVIGVGGQGLLANSRYNDFLLENILTYDWNLDKLGKLDFSFVQSMNEIKNSYLGIQAQGFPNDFLGADGISGAGNILQPQDAITERKILSYMGRVRYNLMNRYLLSLTMRADGSSVFGKDHKWGYFPSVAVAWLISDEDFLSDADFVSNLKLRASYGVVGNQAVTPYRTLGVVSTYQYLFGSNPLPVTGYLPSSELYNPNLKWETSMSTNLGLDFGFIDNRISGTVEWYDTRTKDLLIRKSLPTILGYSNQYINLGEIQNTGVEASLHLKPVKRESLIWTWDFIFSKNRNKILKIDGKVDADGEPINDLVNRWFIGRSANVYYDYVANGIWQLSDTASIKTSYMPNAKPGDTKVVDQNGDGKIDSEDRVVIDRDPKFFYTIRTGLNFKGVDFSVELYGLKGGKIYNSWLVDYNSGGSLNGVLNGVKVDYWTPENPSNTFVRPYQIGNAPYFSSLAYQDASFIRLRNLTLGYTLPANVLDKIKLQSLRVFANLNNFWTKTKLLSYSPETQPGGYPEPRVIQFGLNVSF